MWHLHIKGGVPSISCVIQCGSYVPKRGTIAIILIAKVADKATTGNPWSKSCRPISQLRPHRGIPYKILSAKVG